MRKKAVDVSPLLSVEILIILSDCEVRRVSTSAASFLKRSERFLVSPLHPNHNLQAQLSVTFVSGCSSNLCVLPRNAWPGLDRCNSAFSFKAAGSNGTFVSTVYRWHNASALTWMQACERCSHIKTVMMFPFECFLSIWHYLMHFDSDKLEPTASILDFLLSFFQFLLIVFWCADYT